MEEEGVGEEVLLSWGGTLVGHGVGRWLYVVEQVG